MTELIMPKMGDAMTEGKVVRWYKKQGDAVKKGEPVLEIETDKVNLDLEAEQDGTIGELAANEGQMVPVGGTLATIMAAGEKAPDPQQRRGNDKKDSIKHTTGEYGEAIEMKAPRIDRSAPRAAAAPLRVVEGGRQRSSPLARKMAREMGVSLDAIQGSGPSGRIIAKDIKGLGGAPRPSAAASPLVEKQIPLSAMRRTIAKRLAESTGPIPHFYLTADYDVTNLMSLRQQMNEIAKISVNDFIVKAAALALRDHPNVNASWGDEAITEHGDLHIGLA